MWEKSLIHVGEKPTLCAEKMEKNTVMSQKQTLTLSLGLTLTLTLTLGSTLTLALTLGLTLTLNERKQTLFFPFKTHAHGKNPQMYR